jgi:UDP-N-acetylmuramyl pentapeptide synthase
MKSLEQSLKNQGFAGTLRHFDDLGALAAEAKKLLQPGMLVLIKGSRSMKMETVWQELQKP